MVPNFLIIGAMKSGTTSLWEFLRYHPEVFMPSRKKELHYFSQNWDRGLEWYEGFFAGANGERAIGEACTTYTKYPLFSGVPERMAATLPDARLIYLVREPVERMRSEWQHLTEQGIEKRPLEKALSEDPNYLSHSSFATQIEQYLEHFDRSKLLVLRTEDLGIDRMGVCKRVYDFIGVDSSWNGAAQLEDRNVTVKRRRPRRKPGQKGRRKGLSYITQRVAFGTYRTVRKPKPAAVPPELAAVMRERLRGEVGRLRAYMDDGFDGWGIA
jgi:hypothetical protein